MAIVVAWNVGTLQYQNGLWQYDWHRLELAKIALCLFVNLAFPLESDDFYTIDRDRMA
jgi:hypothetical protein